MKNPNDVRFAYFNNEHNERLLKWMMFDCPACGLTHQYRTAIGFVDDGPHWVFSGTEQRPTWSPSYLTTWTKGVEPEPVVDQCCHFFVKDGMIDYCSDCTHEHAGKLLPLYGE